MYEGWSKSPWTGAKISSRTFLITPLITKNRLSDDINLQSPPTLLPLLIILIKVYSIKMVFWSPAWKFLYEFYILFSFFHIPIWNLHSVFLFQDPACTEARGLSGWPLYGLVRNDIQRSAANALPQRKSRKCADVLFLG